jgi:hypothetical protein
MHVIQETIAMKTYFSLVFVTLFERTSFITWHCQDGNYNLCIDKKLNASAMDF